MDRKTNRVTTCTVSTASHLGWELNFVHEVTGEQQTIHCNGINGEGGNVSASKNGTNSTVSFSGCDHDNTLSGDITAEMGLILNQTT